MKQSQPGDMDTLARGHDQVRDAPTKDRGFRFSIHILVVLVSACLQTLGMAAQA